MIIHCSKKFLEDLVKSGRSLATSYRNKTSETKGHEDSLFIWHAKLYRIEHRKTVILVNDANRFAVILYGLTAKDFKNFDVCVKEAIRATFQRMLIKDEIINRYLQDLGQVCIDKSKNPQSIAWVNAAADKSVFYLRPKENGDMFREQAASLAVSDYPASSGSRKDIPSYRPLRTMKEALAEKYDAQVCGYEAAKLDVSLDLGEYEVNRTLIIPVNISFNDLHVILQIAFDWSNYHLYSFDLDNGEFPNIRITNFEDDLSCDDVNMLAKNVADDLGFEYGGDVRYHDQLADQTLVSAYIENHNSIIYTYDFGDGWIHNIKVVERIGECTEPAPVCIAGIGNAPPEDCGGAGGYSHFVEAYYNEKHEDHEDVVSWSEIVKYREFDIAEINRQLSHMLMGGRLI